ncbi:MAG: hypothetical protein ABIA63_06165 [bacterium]
MILIKKINIPGKNQIEIEFNDGKKGIINFKDEEFYGVSEPLLDSKIFNTATIIDDGMAIGFEQCEFDICANWAYDTIFCRSLVK